MPLPRHPVGVNPTGSPSSSPLPGYLPGNGAVNRGTRASAIKLKTPEAAGGSKGDDKDVDVEEYRPPTWRTVLNRRADLVEWSEILGSLQRSRTDCVVLRGIS